MSAPGRSTLRLVRHASTGVAIVLWVLGFGAAHAAVASRATPDAPLEAGEGIYRRGILPSGKPLAGHRANAPTVEGEAAACIKCHRRSGFGSIEGRLLIPPVTGDFLFRDGHSGASLPYLENAHAGRALYTEATVARAIRDGVDADGRQMNYLMPRYSLGREDLSALLAYLRSLDVQRVPGVDGKQIHLATIVTPDTDPKLRQAFLEVMNQFIADRNGAQRQPAPELRTSGSTSYSKMMLRLSWQLKLHVWELAGPESTWEAQLSSKLAAEPVFAVLSGLGGRSWAPVQAFCERERLPCLFPNVEAPPPDADRQFYTLYFSSGVEIEAQLLAHELATGAGDANHPRYSRVRQIYRAADVGEAAAQRLATLLKASPLAVTERKLEASGDHGLQDALAELAPDEVPVLWLRPGDLAKLPGVPPETVYLSGLMGNLESAPLPPAWRSHAHLTMPVDLPMKRRVRVDFALGWFRYRKIPMVDERVEADTYLACGIFSETLRNMINAIYRDYLIERIEDGLEHRIVTGYYPRLSLATGQRFASKGAFLVRFAADKGQALAVERDWQSF